MAVIRYLTKAPVTNVSGAVNPAFCVSSQLLGHSGDPAADAVRVAKPVSINAVAAARWRKAERARGSEQ